MELNEKTNISDDDEEIVEFIITSNFFNREVRERTHYYLSMRNSDFQRRFRLSKESVLRLVEIIGSSLKYDSSRTEAVSPMNQVLCTLRFFATGSQLITCGDVIGVHESTACRIIHRVTVAIAQLYHRYLHMPNNEEEQNKTALDFYNVARFPRVIGTIDCTHIKINSPGGENAEIFRNRKGYFSINVQAICISNLMFTDIVSRWQGSAHDSTIWDNSNQKRKFLQGHYGDKLLLGDSGYAQMPFMMVPLPLVSTRAESLYNESQIRTRNCIERAFGVWKRRFPILSRGIQVQLRRVPAIIVATAVLHNLAILQGESEPQEDPEYPVTDHYQDPTEQHRVQPPNTGQRERQALIEQFFASLG